MNEETPEEVRMAYYLPKVVEEAVRLHHPEVFIGDMIQEGNIVLMLALKEIRKEKDEEEILEQIRARNAGIVGVGDRSKERRSEDG